MSENKSTAPAPGWTHSHARLADLLIQSGLDKQQLARILGVPNSVINRWLPGDPKNAEGMSEAKDKQIGDIIEIDADKHWREIIAFPDEVVIKFKRWERR